jgi:hypothetical protein
MKNPKDFVEMINIWMPVKNDGQAVTWPEGKSLKLVARLLGDKIIKLEKGFVLERKQLSKEDVNHLIQLF